MDPTIPKNESGHPIKHELTRAIPTSQCIVCHIHPGTNMVASYLGYIWWDNETDGAADVSGQAARSDRRGASRIVDQESAGCGRARAVGRSGFPGEDRDAGIQRAAQEHAVRAISTATAGCFAPCTSAIARAICWMPKIDVVPPDDQEQVSRRPCTSRTSISRKGMHCTDCHFAQDSHGNGNLYGETRNAVEIDCVDCHGTIEARRRCELPPRPRPRAAPIFRCCARRRASGASIWQNGKLYQRSMVDQRPRAVGSGAGDGHASRRAIRTTARRRAWPRRC